MYTTKRPLKVLLVGPQQSGKTVIANHVSSRSRTDSSNAVEKRVDVIPCTPTIGCRIIKFDTKDGVEVELWDISGDFKYERCWSAFLQGNDEKFFKHTASATATATDTPEPSENFSQENVADAIVLVHNPEKPNHLTEIQTWLENFAMNTRSSSGGNGNNLPSNKSRPYCMLLEHKKNGSGPNNNALRNLNNNLPKTLQDRCLAMHSTEFSNLDDVLIKFDNFMKVTATFIV